MSSDSNEKYKYYHYDPSLAAACIFAVVFGITTIWHSILIAKHRTWYFIPMLVGGIFEIVGYAARGVSSGQAPHLTIAPYVIQTLLLLVAPALLAASIYMILGRIIVSVDGESYSLIKKRWLTKVFVTSDVLSFFIQLGGGGLMASSKASSAKLGSHIVLAGLLIQIIIFGFFIVATLVFHLRLRAMPTTQSHDPSLPWKKFLYILYTSSAFIMIRSIVRVAEFVEGFEGVIILHEVFLYVFDGVPMAAVMAIFDIWYPSSFSKQARKVRLHAESVESNRELSNVELQSK
ncbi:related to RTM1 protein [Phialocephala subalpina]|uniref:Related to RTM1 protein n=1 Tax=Phialocephala subalpina TaxID=576137 RepID=A0A1L7X0W2_9HELO|nr:related to RTM1 protein [Phialocephala subalpina]